MPDVNKFIFNYNDLSKYEEEVVRKYRPDLMVKWKTSQHRKNVLRGMHARNFLSNVIVKTKEELLKDYPRKDQSMTPEDLKKRFTYHKPKDDQPRRYGIVRDSGLVLADLINDLCPDSTEKTTAIYKIEEAIFWANASIARNE